MRKSTFYSIILLFIYSCLPKEGKTLSGDVGMHDPSGIIREGNKYWTFSSGDGITPTYSIDLFNWTKGKPVFEHGAWPSWINTYVPNFTGGFWAPDITYMNGKYYVYYSCSTLGSSVSAIGVATSPTLDQSSPDYKWTDLGAVVSSSSVQDVNAIDPSVFKDTNGKVYLTYGSYFNGIGVIELNPATGKVRAGGRLYRVAGGTSSSFEASYLIKEGNYYYLFVNRAHCCKGPYSTYYIVTGRSVSPTGPFFDKNGINLRGSDNTAGGTTVMVTSGRYIAPGHFGLLRDNGRNLVSTHYYDGDYYGEPKLDIADMRFTDDGWPVISRDLLPRGRYKITNKSSNMVWEAAGCNGQEGVQLIQSNDNNFTPCQSWDLTPVGDGYYKIRNEARNEVVDLPFCNSLNGINLQTYAWLNTYCQKFKIEQLVNGSYVFTSMANAVLSKIIQVDSNYAAAGAQLDIFDFNGSARQQWSLSEVSPPSVLNASDITDSGFTAMWKAAPNATAYKLDVSTTFTNAAYQTIAAWSFQSGTNTANDGIADNLTKTVTAVGTNAPMYNAAGNGGQTAMVTGWDSPAPEKYWETNFSTEGFYNLKVSSKQRSGALGPLHFKLQYKIGDSGTYTDIPGAFVTNMDNYTRGVLNNIDLPEECNNQHLVYLRWLLVTSTNISDVTIVNSAESNIDDIVIKGNPGNYLKGYTDMSVTDTTQVITGLSSGSDYYYRIRAVQGSFTSVNSDVIKVTTKGTSPLNFVLLKADQKTGGIQVDWNVYQEKNIESYDVEKSQNGQWFTRIGTVAANAVLNKEEHYNYFDQTHNQDESFYRIKSVLQSGEVQYSSIAKVTIEKGAIGVYFYPNPVDGNIIFIRLSDRAKGLNNITLYNSIGQQIYKKQINHPGGFSTQGLSLGDNITAGIYHLVVTNGNNKSIQTIIINNYR